TASARKTPRWREVGGDGANDNGEPGGVSRGVPGDGDDRYAIAGGDNVDLTDSDFAARNGEPIVDVAENPAAHAAGLAGSSDTAPRAVTFSPEAASPARS